MTAIAYRNGVLAADSAIWSGGVITGHQRKIARFGNTFLAAGGDPAVVEWFLKTDERVNALLDDRFHVPKADGVGFLGLIIDGDCAFRVSEHGIVTRLMAQPFHVLGRPVEFLTGALAAGATAEQAVALAIEMTDAAGGEVHVERLG